MKADIFIHYFNRLKIRFRSILKTNAELYKTAIECFVLSVERILFYKKEIKLQVKLFRVNSKHINRFKQ